VTVILRTSASSVPRLLAGRFRPTLPLPLTTAVADGVDDVVHPVVRTHLERHPGELLKVGLGTRCGVLRAKKDSLDCATNEGHPYPIRRMWC